MLKENSTQRIIFDSGVVATGNKDGSRVLSTLENDSVVLSDLVCPKPLWGRWNPGAPQEVQLYLKVGSKETFEGDEGHNDFLQLAGRIIESNREFTQDLSVTLFHLHSATVHLRSLLLCYAKLTSVAGPRLPFDDVSAHVFHVPSPDAYAFFDAFLVALRSYADSWRYAIWRALGRKGDLPRNIRSLTRTDLPETLHTCIQEYMEETLEEFARYRDNATHYAPPGVLDNTRLIRSNKIIHAVIWLPVNPEVKSFGRFEYAQKDAYGYARGVLERSMAFTNQILAIISEEAKLGVLGSPHDEPAG